MSASSRLPVLLVVLAALVVSGCESGPVKDISRLFESKGEVQLQQGIKSYDDGRLPQAAASFQGALSAGLNERQQVAAHKYLAFINCVQGRDRQCRAHFRTALELDPAFDLLPAEAGHPTWGPVFRSIKKGR